jgi:hypothetical protein
VPKLENERAWMTTSTDRSEPKPGSGRSWSVVGIAKGLLGLASAALPLVEQHYISVLPVSAGLRNGLLPVAILASIAAAAAGTTTAQQTTEGLTVGWISLMVFLFATIALYGVLDLVPRAGGGLYVVFFASFTLSVSSFLSSRSPRR